MNQIHIGIKRQIELPAGGCLVIEDEVRAADRARVFDPKIHGFNPLKDLGYRKTCDFIDTLDALFSRGESTLTKDTGLDFIADALQGSPKSLEKLIPPPDNKSSTGQVWAYGKVQRILRSPILKRMLCSPTNFSFNPRSTILARVNRAELGTFDALAIGLLLMTQFKGQLVVPDFGFYAREPHADLLHQNRLIAGVNFLEELPPRLRQLVLLAETVPSAATFDDAETLALYAGKTRNTMDFNDFVSAAMSLRPTAPQSYADPRSINDRTRNYLLKEKIRIARRAREARERRERRRPDTKGAANWSAPPADPY